MSSKDTILTHYVITFEELVISFQIIMVILKKLKKKIIIKKKIKNKIKNPLAHRAGQVRRTTRPDGI